MIQHFKLIKKYVILIKCGLTPTSQSVQQIDNIKWYNAGGI